MWDFFIKIPCQGKCHFYVCGHKDDLDRAWEITKIYTGCKKLITFRWIEGDDLFDGAARISRQEDD